MIKFFKRKPTRREPTHREQLEQYRSQSHQNFTTIKIRDLTVPIILVDQDRYKAMMSLYTDDTDPDTNLQGVIYSDLNILSDGLGNVFGKLVLTFSDGTKEHFVIDASKNLSFFEQMATSTMFAIAPIDVSTPTQDLLTIQLPRRWSIEEALFKIQRALLEKCSRRDLNPGRELGKLA